MGEERFRNKVTWFTFFYSILVVWVHSYNGELFLGKTRQGQVLSDFEHFFGDTVGQIAVPGFFMISAYLFYRNFLGEGFPPETQAMGQLKAFGRCLAGKWRSRVQSILIPYLLWTSLYYFGYALGSRLPFITRVMGKGVIPLRLESFIDAVLHYRYLYVFWYLHQLILLLALAPALYLLLKPFWSGVIVLALIFAAVWEAADFPLLNEDALFYYGVGAFLALHGRWLEKGWSRRKSLAGIGMIAAGCVNLYFTRRYYLPGTTVLYRLLVPVGLWMLVDEAKLKPPRPWMECNFFLYAVHFALVRLVNKTTALLAPPLFGIPMLLYLAMPGLMVFVSFGMAKGLKKYLPFFWRVANGGR